MVHTRDGVQTIEVVDIQLRIGRHERVDSLVVVQRASGADNLVGPADVLHHLAVSFRTHERSQVWTDSLKDATSADMRRSHDRTHVALSRIDLLRELDEGFVIVFDVPFGVATEHNA